MNEETKQIIDVVMDVAKVLNEKIDNVYTEVQEVNQILIRLETKMDSLEAKTDNLGTRVDSLETTMTDTKSQMNTIAEDIISIKYKSDAVDTTLLSHTYDINRLKKQNNKKSC